MSSEQLQYYDAGGLVDALKGYTRLLGWDVLVAYDQAEATKFLQMRIDERPVLTEVPDFSHQDDCE